MSLTAVYNYPENGYRPATQLEVGKEYIVDRVDMGRYRGIKTWVSFEPVTDIRKFFVYLQGVSLFVDKVKIGKLNYHPSSIDWKAFGHEAENTCKKLGVDYYIKDSLRKEMEVRK